MTRAFLLTPGFWQRSLCRCLTIIYSGGDQCANELIFWLRWAKFRPPKGGKNKRKTKSSSNTNCLCINYYGWTDPPPGVQLLEQVLGTFFAYTGNAWTNLSVGEDIPALIIVAQLCGEECWPFLCAGQELSLDGVLLALAASLEDSRPLPSPLVIALVILLRGGILHSSACFSADTKILIRML